MMPIVLLDVGLPQTCNLLKKNAMSANKQSTVK